MSGFWVGGETAAPDVCAFVRTGRGADPECGRPAQVHMLVRDPKHEGATAIPFCASDAAVVRARLSRGLMVAEHPWRHRGSACGLDGSVWLHEENRCDTPVDTDAAIWVELAADLQAVAA